MKKFGAILLSLLAFGAQADTVTWTPAVKIVGYSVTESGAPSVEIYYEGEIGVCAEADKKGMVTYTSLSNSAEIQKAFILDVVTAKSRDMKMSFAQTTNSVCNDVYGLQIFGLRTDGLTE